MKKSLFLLFAFLIFLNVAHAYKLIVPLPLNGGTEEINGPAEYIVAIYTYGLGLGALLALTMIVIGAVQYTLSEAITSKEDARDRILKAIWGLILLLAATLILNILNPKLTTLEEPAPEFDNVIPGVI